MGPIGYGAPTKRDITALTHGSCLRVASRTRQYVAAGASDALARGAKARYSLTVSSQDVEKLHAWLKTWDLEALTAGELDYSLVDPDVVYEDAILPDHAGEAYRGYEGVARAARVWLAPFEEYSIDVERVFSAGEYTVSVHRFRATFRHTGIE